MLRLLSGADRLPADLLDVGSRVFGQMPSRRASLLPLVSTLILVLGVLTLAAAQLTQAAQLYAQRRAAATAAQYLTDAAAERAISLLRSSPDLTTPQVTEPLAHGEISYAISRVGGDDAVRLVEVEAVGAYAAPRRDLRAAERLRLLLEVSGSPPDVAITVRSYSREPAPVR